MYLNEPTAIQSTKGQGLVDLTTKLEIEGLKLSDGFTYKTPMMLVSPKGRLIVLPIFKFEKLIYCKIILCTDMLLYDDSDIFWCYVTAEGIKALPHDGVYRVKVSLNILHQNELPVRRHAWAASTFVSGPLPHKMLYMHSGIVWPEKGEKI